MDEIITKTENEVATQVPVSDSSVSKAGEEQEEAAENVSEQTTTEETEQQKTEPVAEQKQTEKRPKSRFVPRGMLERIARERDEARRELAELKETLEKIQEKLLSDGSENQQKELDETELSEKLLTDPKSVLDNLIGRHLTPLEIQVKTMMLENLRTSLQNKYPDWKELEPRIVELSRELFPPQNFGADVLLKPTVLEKLYLLAKAEKMDEVLAAERKKWNEEVKKKEEIKNKAVFETGKSAGISSQYSPEQLMNMPLAELEKILPKSET